MEAIIESHTVKELRVLLKQYHINAGTSHMKKAELVKHICINIRDTIRREHSEYSYEIAIDFGIPPDMLNKMIVFMQLQTSSMIESRLRKMIVKLELNLKRRTFNAMFEGIQYRKEQIKITRRYHEKCDELELVNHLDILELVQSEKRIWENEITFELSPHIDKLEEHNQHYKVSKQFGGFEDCHEKILYHGCDEKTKESILNDGNFSLLMCGITHGSKYGKGVYLTDKLWKAVQYSETSKKRKHFKYVLLCKVLVKNISYARAHEISFGKSIDTGVDNMTDSIEYIKKDTNHICVIGHMKISIDKRDCKLLNALYTHNTIRNNPLSGVTFINNYGIDITIYWVDHSSNLTIMTHRLIKNQSTIITTIVGHEFKIYPFGSQSVPSELLLTLVITSSNIINRKIVIDK